MKSIVKVAACVVLAAVTLRYIIGWFNDSSAQYKTTAGDDVIGHVPLQKEIRDFIDDFDGDFQQQIVKVK